MDNILITAHQLCIMDLEIQLWDNNKQMHMELLTFNLDKGIFEKHV